MSFARKSRFYKKQKQKLEYKIYSLYCWTKSLFSHFSPNSAFVSQKSSWYLPLYLTFYHSYQKHSNSCETPKLPRQEQSWRTVLIPSPDFPSGLYEAISHETKYHEVECLLRAWGRSGMCWFGLNLSMRVKSTNNITSENELLIQKRMIGIWNLGIELYKNAQTYIYISVCVCVCSFKWHKFKLIVSLSTICSL